MNKKILSLIIIFFAVSSLGFICFANDLFSSLFVQRDNEKVLEYAHGVDRSGNIYYIRKEKGQSFLVSVDSTGRQSYKKNISDKVTKQGVFDSIFIDQDKNLFLTVYEIMPGSSQITEVGIYMFRDDGSFVTRIFKNKIQQNYDGKFQLVSAMSDDDRNLFFGFLNGTSLDVFAYEKGKTEQVKKINSYSIGEISDKINAFYVLPSGDAIFSLENGTLLKKSNSEKRDSIFQFNVSNRVIIERFWFAGNQFYCQDAVSGNMYISSSSKLEPSVVMKGSKVISEKDRITFAQLNPVTVGNAGNVAGVLNEGSVNRLFLGGFAFLPEIGETDTSDSKDLTKWFLLMGIVAGSIILSLLIWDFYCNILHMKLSMLFRQAFMVILVIFLALYTLTNFIIIPKSEEMIGNVHLAEQIQKGQMFTASCKGFVTSQQGSELNQEKAIAFFDQFRENRSRLLLKTKNETQDEARISLITMHAGQYVLLASDERYEEGFPAARMGYGGDFINGIREADNKTINSVEVMSKNGIERCVLMPTGMTFSGSPVILSIIVGLDVLNKEISDRTGTITVYMALVGLILALLVMVVEYFTVHNVRRLKNSVDKIAEGNYGYPITIDSGDEIEDLSDSIRALAKNILTTTNSLNKLNESYYRFVPQRFLEILGETHIENVGKKSQGQKENVVMLFLRFRFQSSMGEKSKDIFSNINDVFENVAPVVSDGKGTIYDFLPDGFNAVFESQPEETLRTALRICEVLEALNEKRKGKGQGKVDIRIFISKGNIMLGFVGEEKRMEPTAISKEAQKADTIVQICFDSEIYIACTKEVLEALPSGAYRSRRIGEVMIQEEKEELFDLYDSDPYTLLKAKEVNAQRFELGVNLFMKRDYFNARNVFMDIIKYSSQDGVARNYMYLAEHNLRSDKKQSTYTTIYELEKMR